MNSTQKTAWIFIVSFLFTVVGVVYVGSILYFRRLPPRPLGQIAVAAVTCAAVGFLVLIVFFLAKRQSRVEPEADERDHLIRGKALTISSVCSSLLLAVVLLILGLTLGQTGSIPVYLVTLILWGIFQVALLIYALVVLVQYGRGGKDE